MSSSGNQLGTLIVHGTENEVLTLLLPQQLLEIWNKAKTKERDALLWGDEVHGKPILFLKWHDILTGIRRWNTSWLSTARTTRRWLSR